MGRRKKIDRPREIAFQIPDSIYSKVQAELYSEVEGKVPFGAKSELVSSLLIEWLRERGITV